MTTSVQSTPTPTKSKRVMTSAINGMTVAEVRRYLGETRKRWKDQTKDHPMYPTDCLSNNMTIQEFALRFELGHHKKRHNKGKRRGKRKDQEYSDDELAESLSDDNSPIDLSSESETSPELSPEPRCAETSRNKIKPSPIPQKTRPKRTIKPVEPPSLRRSRRLKNTPSTSHTQTLMDFAR